jgi:hypothetical protein
MIGAHDWQIFPAVLVALCSRVHKTRILIALSAVLRGTLKSARKMQYQKAEVS